MFTETSFIKMRWILILLNMALCACTEQVKVKTDFIIGAGQMPAIAIDNAHTLHLVFGTGDSVLYSSSSDNGVSFTSPVVVSVVPKLFDFAMRGPQIAVTHTGVIITACTELGNIYAITKEGNGTWSQPVRVNDVDTIAKEGLMALGADGQNAFATWLDLRGNKRNKIYGAASDDGGKTWSKNVMVYTSPDTTVCECCKPSAIVKGNDVYVMFRNWISPNRDMYLAHSVDGGKTFAAAEKLGQGNWALNGCPMDGGGLALNTAGIVQTVWRREAEVFAATPGKPETRIGDGKGCTIETVGDKNVYAWSENGEIVVLDDKLQKRIIGKGSLPKLKALDEHHIICVWENDKKVHAAIIQL